MARRRLTLVVVSLLLMGMLPVQAASVLVCRFTGQPMAPIEAAPEALPQDLACCAVKQTVSPDGTPNLVLAAPGCCDLKVTAERPDMPPATHSVLTAFVPALTPPSPVVVHAPSIDEELVTPSPVLTDAPPRGPPGRPTSLRAPPFFS